MTAKEAAKRDAALVQAMTDALEGDRDAGAALDHIISVAVSLILDSHHLGGDAPRDMARVMWGWSRHYWENHRDNQGFYRSLQEKEDK